MSRYKITLQIAARYKLLLLCGRWCLKRKIKDYHCNLTAPRHISYAFYLITGHGIVCKFNYRAKNYDSSRRRPRWTTKRCSFGQGTLAAYSNEYIIRHSIPLWHSPIDEFALGNSLGNSSFCVLSWAHTRSIYNPQQISDIIILSIIWI